MRTSNDQDGLPVHRGKGMATCSCDYPMYAMAEVANCGTCGKPIRNETQEDGAAIQANRRAAATKANKGSAY